MRKSSAIRAAMRLREWCRGRQGCLRCMFYDKDGYVCSLRHSIPAAWPAMSFDDEVRKDATD